jgi:methylated-DNA-[protein]-cysteine S-methyltransferase
MTATAARRRGTHFLTPFQERVLAVVAEIPRGRVMTYAQVACAIGCGSPRAVGQALKRNPYAPRVPCHRVIAADLTPGGFQGAARGARVTAKLALLAREGVRFADGRLAEARRLHAVAGRSRS